ncbi:putative RNA-directed DNA polymerase [Tanacetum coccineum]
MASSMSPELQNTFENTWAYEMNQQLQEMFQAKASKERLDVVKYLMACKPKPRASICAFVLEMKGYFNSLLQTAKQGIKKSDVPSISVAPVLTVGHNAKKIKTSHSNWKGKATQGKSDRGSKRKIESEIAPTSDPKEAVCFYYNTKGHWKHSFLKYPKDLKDGKVKKGVHSGMYMIELHNTTTSDSWVLDTGCGTHICVILQGLKESRRLKHGELNLIMGNRKITPVTRIGKFELMLKSEVRINLNNCCYSSEMTRNIILFHALFKDGYQFSFDNENGDILVYSNGCFMFKASPCKGIYETVECISNDGNMILNVGSSNELDKSKLWHSSWARTCERGEGLLDLVHTDVCGPFRSAIKDGKRYYLTPPRTPQLNGVAKRRNRTLLDMVRSMMCRATLPISFWGYTLETTTHILNLVPTKKVSNTPFETWKGKRTSLGHIKIWGCEIFVRREAQDKLEARSKKCLFIGYPKESFGYLFYKPKDNVVFVARRGVFLEREMISKEDSGSKIDLEEIQESVDEEPIITTDTQQEVVTPVKPDDISLLIRRTSSRVSKPSQDPQFYYGFHIEEDKISDSTLTELNKPANYKEAMASPESSKWKEAMKSEVQSMYDNQVWNLVDTTTGFKTVGCKWIFKKKTNMDGKVHTYKARLVAKGYTQTHEIDYEETFSPVAKIKSIRIMLSIAAFHDYEIWQMDVKTAFLNEKLTRDASRSWNLCLHEKVTQFGFSRSEDESCVYVKVSGSVVVFLILYVDDILLIGNDISTLQSVKDWLGKCFAMKDLGDAAYILGIKIYRDRTKRLIGLSQDTYLDKILKRFRMDNSKKGNLPLHHGIKIRSIMYAMTCTRPDVSFALSMGSSDMEKFKTKYLFVRSKVEEGHVIVKDIRSEDNPADPFTKALAKSKHDEHAKSIGLKDKIEF